MDQDKRNEFEQANDTAIEETVAASPDDDDIDEDDRQASVTEAPVQERQQGKHAIWSAKFYRSHVVENQGNVARDHLASERTFLAYARTALVCLTAGVAVVQLLTVTPSSVSVPLERFGKVLGSVTEAFGIIILIIAISRYFSVQKALLSGKYSAAILVIWLIAFAFVVVIFIAFGLMLGVTFS